MNEQFIRQAEKMFQDARLPENFQAFAQDSVAKSREAFAKLASVAADQAKTVESVATEAQSGVKTLGEKALGNLARNASAAFDAADALARAKSIPEAAKLQADFVQSQLAAFGLQTKEFLELSTRIAQQSFEAFGSAAAKGFEQSKSFAEVPQPARGKR